MSEAAELAKSFIAMYGDEAANKAAEYAERQKRNADPATQMLWQSVVEIIKATNT